MDFLNWIKRTMGAQLTIGALLFWVPVLLVARIANEVAEHEPLSFDVPILSFMDSLSSDLLDHFVASATHLGGVGIVASATVLVVILAYKKLGRRAAALAMIVAGGAAVINVSLKLLFQRARPDVFDTIVTESTYSFPSGHAMGSSALALSIVILLWNTKWRTASIIIGFFYVVFIGISRIYLGVHYPSDVLAGWGISIAWSAIVYKIVYQSRSVADTSPVSSP